MLFVQQEEHFYFAFNMQFFSFLAPKKVSQIWLIHSVLIKSQVFTVGYWWLNLLLEFLASFIWVNSELKPMFETTDCFKSTISLKIWKETPKSEGEKLNIWACHLSQRCHRLIFCSCLLDVVNILSYINRS